MKNRPLIFVTNDDGIDSPGIRALAETMLRIGDIKVVAPSKPMSGVGHCITIREGIEYEPVDFIPGVEAYICSGTPVDCVKFGMSNLFDTKPDLLVSGINHGSNASINILYSGTVAAAMEGIIEGVPSIGFSLTKWEVTEELDLCRYIAEQITIAVIEKPLPEGVLLNVNIPDVSPADFKGIKICKQARSCWIEKYIEKPTYDGRISYLLTGDFISTDDRTDTDLWALENGYVSVVPVHLDMTANFAIPYLLKMERIQYNNLL